jgi:hypothetical protein
VHIVRQRSQKRFAQPVGVVDDLIRQIQARQRSAAPTIQRVSRWQEEDEAVKRNGSTGEEAASSRRHKKRGGSNRNKQQEGAIPSHMHLMYREGDESELFERRSGRGT